MCYVNCKLLGWAGLIQVVVVEVRLVCKEYLYFIPLALFRSLLIEYRVVWYSPLASTIFFVDYEPEFLWYLSFSSFLRFLGDL